MKNLKKKRKRKINKKKKKGFTLIELLAVVIILGVLMIIAIPSVSNYTIQSRKNALVSTIDNYISTLSQDVNSLNYEFFDSDAVYAVPIECLGVEKGGTSPFGEWHQANDEYWAYVLVQYDVTKYTYGFTFKDSAGYGLYPLTSLKIDENGEQLSTELKLNKPVDGELTSTVDLEKWKESGFRIDENTKFYVLTAETDGVNGDGKTTCTLKQKGENYTEVEQEKNVCKVSGVKTCDETPGTLSGSGRKNSPYLIESIEDLVTFANIINNKQYETGFYSIMTYEGRKVNYNFYVELNNNLDFKSRNSYVNPDTTEFGDVNNNGEIEPLIVELNSGNGFPMIDAKEDEDLKIFFDGKGHYLKNYNYNIVNSDASKTINVSLFGTFDGSFSSTNITNLVMKDVDINIDTAGSANVAVLIQEISSYDTHQLSDITIDGKIDVKCGGTCNVGGLAHTIFTYGSDARDAVSNVNLNLDIDVVGNNAVVGGFTSKASNYGYYILDSNFKGDINVKATNSAEVGGVTGYALYFKSVNSSVESNITVDTKSGEVYGLGEGTIYNSFYKGDLYVKSYTPLNMSCLGSKNIYNSYAICNMTVDAQRRDNYPKIGGLSSGGSIYNSYHIGDLKYNTVTSYGGSGPTILGSLLTVSNSVSNSFARGKVTNTQNSTWYTWFGLLTAYKDGGSVPVVTNSYYSEDSSYSGKAPCRYDGEVVTISDLRKATWYKDTLKLDDNWVVSNNYYPLINKCNFDPSTSTCTATNNLLDNQIKVQVQ